MKIAIRLLLGLILIPITPWIASAQVQPGGPTAAAAVVLSSCGSATYTAGQIVTITQNTTGALCISGNISATSALTATATLPTLSPGAQSPQGSLAGAAYVQPVFSSATGGGTQVDATHGLPVNIVGGGGSGGTAQADEATFTQGTSSFTPVGGLYTTSVTNLTTGQGGAARLTADRMLFVNLGDIGGAAYALGSTTSAASAPVVIASDQAAVAVKQATAASLNATVVGTGTFAVQDSTTETNTGTIAGAVTASVMQENLKQVNGITTLTGAGATGTGAQRVGVAQDTTTIAGSAPGSAGTASANVVTVQGVTSMTPVQVSQATAASLNATVVGTGTFAVQDSTTETNTGTIAGAVTSSVMQENVKQVNGVTTLAGTGAVGTGAQRIAVGQDTATIAGSAPGTAGTPSANVVTIQGATSMTPLLDTPSTATFVTGTASATGTSTTSLVGAVTSQHIYATAVSCSNSGATAATVVFQDGSGGTTLWEIYVPAGGGNNLGGGRPLFRTTAGNALFFASGGSTTTMFCNAAGFSSAN